MQIKQRLLFLLISNFNQFKNILKSWNGIDCKCSVCADFKSMCFTINRSCPSFILLYVVLSFIIEYCVAFSYA